MSAALEVPIVDLGAFAAAGERRLAVARAVDAAMAHSGFMYVTGHGIEPALIARAFAAMRDFFAQPHDVKDAYAYTDIDANFGFQGMALERLDPGSMPDLKESFTMRNASFYAGQSDRWPRGDFRDAALALYDAGMQAAYGIMRVLAANLDLPADFFTHRHGGENVTLRFLHYPAGLTPSAAQLGAGAHTDYGSITLLFQDSIGGLELLTADGTWQAAPPVPGAAVINTGDLMERWTNGRYRSTVHRVKPIAGLHDRYSIALFVDPDTAVDVECFASCVDAARPLRYARITAGEHIRQKIAASQPQQKESSSTR